MRKNSEGFSLVELMVVISLVAIMAGLAIPSYRLMIGKTELRVATEQLMLLLNSAREAAIHYQTEVMVCGSRDGLSCNADWAEGQRIAFMKTGKNHSVHSALPPSIKAEWRSNLGHNHSILFSPTGLPKGQWGSFWLSSSGAPVKARITVNALGHLTLYQ